MRDISSADRVIALWAVPRSISTAFELVVQQRGDHRILHEPFFDVYETSVGRSAYATPDSFDYRSTVKDIRARILALRRRGPVFLKEMAYHVAQVADSRFLDGFCNTFIVRHPLLVYRSLSALVPPAGVEPAAYSAQFKLFDIARRNPMLSGPVVVSADDFVTRPVGTMYAFCEAVGLDFRESVMSWVPGYRKEWSDGKEAYWPDERRWYHTVANSTSIEARATAPKSYSGPAPYGGFRRDVRFYEEIFAARVRPKHGLDPERSGSSSR